MNKRVSAIAEVELLPFLSYLTIRDQITIKTALFSCCYVFVSGSLVQCRSVCEQYCLKWESCYLLDLGSILDSLWDGLVSVVAQEALRYTVLSGTSCDHNPWGVCLSRSAEVGKHLTQVLQSQGKWPVNLTGFSLGAHVIYFCLEELANDQGSEDVVLLGAPEDGSEKAWQGLGDWLLGFLYGSSSVQRSVAGLQPISSQDCKIINVDLSSVVSKYMYALRMNSLMFSIDVVFY
uniref:Uncharacterized protein n=1 Tax=Cyprinus carpio TaxID=7962 RepID=A0A8C2FPH9_CYPCA